MRPFLIEALNAIQITANQLLRTHLARVERTAQLLDRGVGGTEGIIRHRVRRSIHSPARSSCKKAAPGFACGADQA
jgi:hypothetical protein